jgi:exo-beta-1,3-glucanase (GH17 family)
MPGEGAIAPAAYLATMYQDGAKGYFDDVAVHPYSYPQMPLQPDDWNTFYDLSNVRQVMVANGDSAKKIWLTEFGCPTGTAGGFTAACTDASLAMQITQAYGQANAWGWIGQLFIYSWQDDNVSGDGDFGLYYSNGAPKAASLAAYQQAVA